MKLITETTTWVRGEVFQGKIMLAAGIMLLAGAVLLLKSDHEILRGILIPLGIILLIMFGYGGMQTFYRPTQIAKITKDYQENPELTLSKIKQKALRESKAFVVLKLIWVSFIILSGVFYIITSSPYQKGLAIGLIGLFLTALIVDTAVHHRLDVYLKGIERVSLE